MLIQYAQRLSSSVRDSDLVARLARDIFTVLLDGLAEPAGDAKRVADKIIASLERPFLLSGSEVSVTASLGLVVPEGGEFDAADLLARGSGDICREARGQEPRHRRVICDSTATHRSQHVQA